MTASVVPALPLSAFDASVRPQDDLYAHVNGRWLAQAEIPEDKPLTGAFVELRDRAEEAVRDIITGGDDAGGDPGERRLIDALYASFMDAGRVERLGADPLRPALGRIFAVQEAAQLPRLFGELMAAGITSIVGADVDADPGEPQRYALFVGQSGLGLPDEEYYREEQYADIRAAYLAHVERSLGLTGLPDAYGLARLVFDLETEIARLHWDKVTTRDMRKMYNPMPASEAGGEGFDLVQVLRIAGLEDAESLVVVNTQPSYLQGLSRLFTEDRMPAWRAWACWHLISDTSPYLSEAFVTERFDFYGRTLSGTPALRERWKRGVALVEGVLGEAVGKVYVERHFPAASKTRMDELVANLIEAYRRSISVLDWMTAETRAQALDKLDKFTPKIGYPQKWRDYSGLELSPDDLVGNVRRASAHELAYQYAKVGRPVEAHEWFMTPQTVNAYYHPLRNEIVFPAAICQPPFFNPDADDAVNYGGIGSVIGHEIGHGFDDQGSTCDGDGRLRDWWTDVDRQAFEQRTAALIEQYNALSPAQAPDLHVNGELTIGENIGDLGGLSIAHLAWRIATEGTEPPAGDGYTAEQRLFLGWGAIWQQKAREEAVRQRLATDPHSPPEFRCNQILRNSDAFAAAFDVQPGDGLWLEPQERVRIW